MVWPETIAFTGAVQNPRQCFHDRVLATGRVAMGNWGLPLMYSGNFATVYKVSNGGQDYAVRCFSQDVEAKGQGRRYQQLEDYLREQNSARFVGFDYQENGIRVNSNWYPIVKMDWVNGQTLDRFVERNLHNRNALTAIAEQWRDAAVDLQRQAIAHNDLQHGNIIVQEDGFIRFVDYDGIFLPQYLGEMSPEEGHKNYQHPQRTAKDYSEHIDNFPALVIYLSLLAVAANPSLWKRFYDEDNLLFTKSDFLAPEDSEIFHELRNSADATIVRLTEHLEEYCCLSVSDVRVLETVLAVASTPRKRPTVSAGPSPLRQLLLEQQDVRAVESTDFSRLCGLLKAAGTRLYKLAVGPQKDGEHVVDPIDFFLFCCRLDGQELKTLSLRAPFRVTGDMSTSNVYFTPSGTSVKRTCGISEVERFLECFEETGSRRPGDYRSVTNNASYLLSVVDRYLYEADEGLETVEAKADVIHAYLTANVDRLRNHDPLPVKSKLVVSDNKLRESVKELKRTQATLRTVWTELTESENNILQYQNELKNTKGSLQNALSKLKDSEEKRQRHWKELEQKRNDLRAVRAELNQSEDKVKHQGKELAQNQAALQTTETDLLAAREEVKRLSDQLAKWVITCPGCNEVNPTEAIYCINQNCLMEIYPNRQTCNVCRAEVSAKASFCNQCRSYLVAPTEA